MNGIVNTIFCKIVILDLIVVIFYNLRIKKARVAELADALDLGSSGQP